MVTRQTIDFLPGAFKSETNKKFLNATLDQLMSEPELTKVNGFVGRKFSPSFLPSKNYVAEAIDSRQNYQFEPAVVVKNASNRLDLYSDYQDLIDKISYYGGVVNDHNRLFASEYYRYDPHIDLDKFVNYNQYYWLPDGPLPVTVSAGTLGTPKTFSMARGTGSYTSDQTGNITNPEITLVRGVTYQFNVNQTGNKFWIQTEPGIDGLKDYNLNVTTRSIQGVSNNGAETGTITFTVPSKNSQDYYFKLPLIDYVDYAITNTFSSIDGAIWRSNVAPTGSLTALDNEGRFPNNFHIVFLSTSTNNNDWIDNTGVAVPASRRQGLWRVTIDPVTSRVRLLYVRDIPIGYRIRVKYGDINAGYEFFKNSSGLWAQSPPITAPLSTLYYQDGTTAGAYGKINIVDLPGNSVNVDADIVGKSSYTSPNGIVFSNGLRVAFDSSTTPLTYHNKTFIVEGVGTGIKLVDFDKLVPVEAEKSESYLPFDTFNFDVDKFDQTVLGAAEPDYIVSNRSSQDLNSWARTNRWFHADVILKTAEYLGVPAGLNQSARAQRPIIEFEADLQLYNYGRIGLATVDRIDSVLTAFVAGNDFPITDAFAQIENKKVSDASIDLMNYIKGQTTIFPNDVDINIRSKIFRIDFKNQLTANVFDGVVTGFVKVQSGSDQIIDATAPTQQPKTSFDSELEPGTVLYTTAGVYVGTVKVVVGNSRLILESPATVNLNFTQLKYNSPRIELTPITTANTFDSVVAITGSNAKKSYYFNGTNWVAAQQKIKNNQAPLFDVVNQSGTSFSQAYSNSAFIGTKLFSYKPGSSTNDAILGFPLSYSSIGNSISDINFDNNFEVETFVYGPLNSRSNEKVISGYLRKNLNRTEFSPLTVWSRVAEPSKQYQHISAEFDGQTNYFEIDILPAAENKEPNIKVYVNNKLINSTEYTIQTVGVRKAVSVNRALILGDAIDILIYSNQISKLGYYQIPKNLDFNPKNAQITSLTLGQIRGHWYEIGQNTRDVVGEILASNNLRDLDTQRQGGTILQHSAPTIYSSLFLIDSHTNFIEGIDYARREYTKFKNKFLELCVSMTDLDPVDPTNGVDRILKVINQVKTSKFPWFYSDMVPYGDNYVVDLHKITNISVKTYAMPNVYSALGNNIYPGRGPHNQAISVYFNDTQLIYGQDYTIGSNTPTIVLADSLTIALDDIVSIRGYLNTDGNFVPETPTKLGLFPKFIPQQYTDNTYRQSITVIQGHDGSITPTFGDLRDAYLIELEKRIYNNIKIEYNSALFNLISVLPGKFRNSPYTLTEFNRIITTEFLKWVGSNQLDYSSNETYNPNDQFTWNYNQTDDQTGEKLTGYWRGIYKYYYDTDRPHTHPWEMLGYTIKPTWWNTHYGSGPYTSSSTQMWTDLENGYSRGTGTTNSLYSRAGLKKYIPVDNLGSLLPPQAKLVRNFDGTKFDQSFAIGDHGPVESGWRRTSEYPYALQRAMALMRPAQYFGLLFDTSRYHKNTSLTEYLIKNINRRVSPEQIVINGETVNGSITRSGSYINWIHGYLTSLGIDANNSIRLRLSNLDVRLGYKVSGYTDKKYITALVEQFSPTSTNESVIIPDENYLIHLNKSVPVRRAVYSAVIIEKTNTGYSISGYNLKYPYFTVIPSEFNNNNYAIEVLGSRALVFQDYKSQKINIPYGYEFSNSQQVVDFLVGYQRFLLSQGFIFDFYDTELKSVRDWILSAKEFLTWSQQGWKPGNVLVLSPILNSLSIFDTEAVLDQITNQTNERRVLDANFNAIKLEELSVLRQPNISTITTILGKTIAFVDLNLVQYEHALVFDNVTVFDDIVYKPELGSRQHRMRLIGSKTSNWNGAMNPPGFIYKFGQVDEWLQNTDYKKADIIKYKNQIYTAAQNVPGSTTFDFNYWTLLDTSLEPEIVPNFAHNSVKSVDFYDIDRASIDESFDQFSMGLIGYRSRPYLENLGMDQITQSKFYQGFIKEKGTKNSIVALFGGQFDDLVTDLSLHEEWALRVGEYGALRSNQSIELILDEEKFKGNPIAFKLLNSAQPSEDLFLTVRSNDLISKPLNFSSPIFLNRPLSEELETDIKTAGYVHLDDVDGRLFNINDYSSLTASILAGIETGYRLWVAKDFDEDWQVYLISEAANSVVAIEYALDDKIQITTFYEHGLQTNDVIAVRSFNDSRFDGFYKVLTANSPTQFIVTINEDLIQYVIGGIIEGSGELFTLQKSRYRTLTARDNDIVKTSWEAGNRVWVDNNGNNTWAVYDFVSSVKGNYSGTQHSWGIENGTIALRSSGLPYHTSGLIITVGNVATTYTPAVKNYHRIWPLRAGSNVAATVSQTIYSEQIGFAINGVPFASPNAGEFIPPNYEEVTGYNYNYMFSNANVIYSRDAAGGLVTDDDSYYYQGYTFANSWVSGSGGISGAGAADVQSSIYLGGSLTHANGHSKILGFANDGYPIYGPYGYSQANNSSSAVQRMVSGYTLRNSSFRDFYTSDLTVYPLGIFVQDYEFTSAGNLDRHNGRYCVTPEYPNGTYAYFMTIDAQGKPAYPYVIGDSYYGSVPEVSNPLVGGTGIAPIGFTGISSIEWIKVNEQKPVIDINSVGGIYVYNDTSKSIQARLDLYDPVKGKILGIAQADIDFVSTYDPAKYNQGTFEELPIEQDFHWGNQQIGKIWWDLDNARFMDYEQGTRDYRLEHWGKLFPGSSVEVYEWVETDVLPSGYVEAGLEGIPKYADDSAYSMMSFVDSITGIIQTRYYYWVRNRSTVANSKTHSVSGIANIIAQPELQNIPYAICLSNDTIGLYNIGGYITAKNAILHIDYRVKLNQDVIHSEFDLFQEGNQYSVMHPRIENKIIDSLVGQDVYGNLVPQPGLIRGNKIGLSIKPRQTLIENRYVAAENIIKYINSVLIKHAITSRIINKELVYSDNFYADTPIPEHDYAVDTDAQFSYVPKINAGSFEVGKKYIITDVGTTNFMAIGASSNTVGTVFMAYGIGSGTGKAFPSRILVRKDARYLNRWSLFLKNFDGTGTLNKFQSLKITDFWYTVDWYADGYSSKTTVNYSVDRFADVYKLTLINNDIIKVINNGANRFEIYKYENNQFNLIGLEDGTIQIKDDLYKPIGFDYANFSVDNYDYNHATEFRFILKGIKEDIFVRELAPLWNKLLFFIIEYILSEQKYIDWAFKTSFVSVTHKVEGLTQTPAYIKDRQLYYKQYVDEVKPYRTKIREYSLAYNYVETTNRATVTDFDLPAYFDKELEIFRSPSGEAPNIDNNLLSTKPEYQDWKNHHKYNLDSIVIAEKGRGFLSAPDITVVSNDTTGTGANAKVIIDVSDGSLYRINVTQTGKDYTQTPILTLSGTGTNPMSLRQSANFLPAKISARISNTTIRKIKTTMKFDRVTYTTSVVDWQPGVSYPVGTLVSYRGQGYVASASVPAGDTFNQTLFTTINSGSFNNANDRIMAFYAPTADMPPKLFYRLMSGFRDYPEANATPVATSDSLISGGGFSGSAISAGSFVVGQRYIITSVGTTNFTAIGASANRVGVIFVATGVGLGTGKAVIAISSNVALGNVAGISSEEIVVQGGAFVSELFAHGPEEILPGRMFDSVSIMVKTNGTGGNVGYRRTVDMNANRVTTVINLSTNTTLAQVLKVTDTVIQVADGAVLATPDPVALLPGKIVINGETIHYYVKNGNQLSQLRRGVGGTGTPSEHRLGSIVESANDIVVQPYV